MMSACLEAVEQLIDDLVLPVVEGFTRMPVQKRAFLITASSVVSARVKAVRGSPETIRARG